MNFKPILIGEVFRNSNGVIESQRSEIGHTLAGDEQLRRDQQFLHEQLSEQNRDLREAHMKKSSRDGRIEASSRVKIR